MLITSRQAKQLDLRIQRRFSMPELLLMENAGRSVAEELRSVIKKRQAKIAIFCGKGNNAGDGFVAARHLLASGIIPDLYLAGRVEDVKGQARVNLEILLKLGQRITEVKESNLYLVKRRISDYNFILDALLGVGLRGKLKGIFSDLIALINSSKAYIVSVDLPSGLDATTGRILDDCIKADRTVTFVAKKRGMAVKEGKKYCGKIIVRGLGISLIKPASKKGGGYALR